MIALVEVDPVVPAALCDKHATPQVIDITAIGGAFPTCQYERLFRAAACPEQLFRRVGLDRLSSIRVGGSDDRAMQISVPCHHLIGIHPVKAAA